MHAESVAGRVEAAAPAAPLRKAALLLHSMCEADRRWMLQQVDGAQRARLGALLGELGALDFPRDPALLREALKGAAPVAVPAQRGPAQWSADDALHVFQHEPDAVIAVALAAADATAPWPWEAGLLRRLGAERASAVAACRDRFALQPRAPALVDAVLAASRARFDAPPAPGAAVTRRTS